LTCYRFDIISKRMSVVPALASVTAAHPALLTDRVYVVDGTAIKALGDGSVQTGTWRSRRFAFPWAEGFGWVRVNGPDVTGVVLRYYLDGVLVHTATFNDRKPQRLPARKGYRVELELEAAVRITSISVAQSAEELHA
jgi:hypothetical protein